MTMRANKRGQGQERKGFFIVRSALGLIHASSEGVYIGVDHTHTYNSGSGRGRPSVRLTSTKLFNTGSLFIADLTHIPTACGAWPAYWMVGPDWPDGGEIDIIEGTNLDTVVKSTLHTNGSCDMESVPSGSFTGHWDTYNGQLTTDCYVNAYGQGWNLGCGIMGAEDSFGAPFNSRQGGAYATEWTSQGIGMWFFSRNNIPSDILAGHPNPTSWGKPYALFQFGSNCSPSHFSGQNLVIDITFCGSWAGDALVWNNSIGCSQYTSGCQDFVQNNPSAFSEAYWYFNSIKVYQCSNEPTTDQGGTGTTTTQMSETSTGGGGGGYSHGSDGGSTADRKSVV